MTAQLFADTQSGDLPNWLFNESSGIHVAGIPGSGKSNFLLYLTKLVASNSAYPLFLLDPAGDTAKAARDLCWSLSPSARKRLYYIRPSDIEITVPLNPLRVRHHSHLAAKVAHCNHILLHAWGAVNFNETPRLAKWSSLAVQALALLGLPLCHTLDILDPASPAHATLVDAIDDPLIYRELLKIRGYSVSEWDDQIGSSFNRWFGFFMNPYVQAILSHRDGLDFSKLINDRAIVLIDLATENVLRPEDQEIIANLYLSELLQTVTNVANPAERIPTFLLIDELPVFHSSFTQIEKALREVRKYLLRMVCCHQGVYSFPDGPRNPLLNNLMNCKTQFFFQILNQADSKFFGDQLALSDYDPLTVKHVLKQTQFYTAGHDIINLIQEGQSYSQTTEQTEGEGEEANENKTWNTTKGIEKEYRRLAH